MLRRLALIFCLLCGLAEAQPAAVSRVLQTMDFEERRLGNVEELPMHWTKLEGPTLPHYVNGRLATDRARSGHYSFRFDLNGGGLVYRYDPQRIRVQVGAHYRIEAYVQTDVLAVARARLTAYLTDGEGHRIETSLRHSDLYAAKVEAEPWHRLRVELSADEPAPSDSTGAPTYLVIELGLLQPEHYAARTLGDRALLSQDIYGTAWFDDVTVSQVPRVALETGRPGNIFRRSDLLKLDIDVNDRLTDDLAAQLVVRDARGTIAYQRSGALDLSTAQAIGPGQRRVSLVLPELPPGWYQGSLVMSSQGRFVGEQPVQFVVLADDAPPGTPDPRFGLIATDLPFEVWHELPDVLPILGAGRIKLAVWNDQGDIDQLDPAAFDELLERLDRLGIAPTACLVGLPPSLQERIGGASWQHLLKVSPDLWRPRLAELFARYASHLERWQLGQDGTDAFVTDADMRQVYQLVYQQFGQQWAEPDLAMPWPAWYELEGQRPAAMALSIPPWVLPSQIPLYIEDLHHQQGEQLSLSLQPLDRTQYGRDMEIIDLVQRVVYSLSAGASRIDVPLPLSFEQTAEGWSRQPHEMILVLRTLINTLSGASYRGKLPVADGVEAFVFERNGEGIVVLWNTGAPDAVRRLALRLGERPMRMDVWGLVSPLVRAGSVSDAPLPPGDETVLVDIGAMPQFLLHVDADAAQLRASVAIDQPLLESSFEAHHRHIQFHNPYDTPISGTMRLRPPEGWTINPPTFAFSLNPGETFSREVAIEFPYNSYAGPKTIQADFAIQGERETSFAVPVTLHLGLSDVGIRTLALRDGQDVLVQQMITNYGESPIDYTAFAIFPGQARQERLVTNLGPGRTVIKRYRFTNVQVGDATTVRSGMKQIAGTRILNEEVPVR